MAILTDLHDDLNLSGTKTHLRGDEEGLSESELAERAWKGHCLRENSIIQTLFAGQFRSVLTCQECHLAVATYDPFLSISLPLPSKIHEEGCAEEERTMPIVITIHIVPRCEDSLEKEKQEEGEKGARGELEGQERIRWEEGDKRLPITKCRVRVLANGTIGDVLDASSKYNIERVDGSR